MKQSILLTSFSRKPRSLDCMHQKKHYSMTFQLNSETNIQYFFFLRIQDFVAKNHTISVWPAFLKHRPELSRMAIGHGSHRRRQSGLRASRQTGWGDPKMLETFAKLQYNGYCICTGIYMIVSLTQITCHLLYSWLVLNPHLVAHLLVISRENGYPLLIRSSLNNPNNCIYIYHTYDIRFYLKKIAMVQDRSAKHTTVKYMLLLDESL